MNRIEINDQTERVFEPVDGSLPGAIYVFIFFSVIGVAAAGVLRFLEPQEVCFWCAISMGGSCVLIGFGMAILLLTAWKRLTLRGASLEQGGVFRTKLIEIKNVNAVRWIWQGRRGGVTLLTDNKKIRILFQIYSNEDLLWLTQFFRETFPETMQEDWNQFCLQVAIPCTFSEEVKEREPGPHEVILTRKNFDRIFIVGLALSFIVSGFSFWLTGDWKFVYPPPVMMLVLWFPLRLRRATKKTISPRLISHSEDRKYWVLGGIWIIIVTGFAVWIDRLELSEAQHTTAYIIMMFVSFIPILWLAMIFDKQRKIRQLEFDQEVATAAAQCWKDEQPTIRSMLENHAETSPS